MYDKDAVRFALIAVLPPLVLMCAFPCSVLVASLVRAIHPDTLLTSALYLWPGIAVPPEFGFLQRNPPTQRPCHRLVAHHRPNASLQGMQCAY
jgi:hypothetical protein